MDLDAFKRMPGVGDEKFGLYGAKFTDLIRAFVEQHPDILLRSSHHSSSALSVDPSAEREKRPFRKRFV